MRTVRAGLSVVLLLLIGLLAGCSSTHSGSATDSNQPPGGALTVMAASSLTEAFGRLGHTFAQQHPGVHVRFSFDSSATLAEQVAQGAPADVLDRFDVAVTRLDVVAARRQRGVQGVEQCGLSPDDEHSSHVPPRVGRTSHVTLRTVTAAGRLRTVSRLAMLAMVATPVMLAGCRGRQPAPPSALPAGPRARPSTTFRSNQARP